MIYNNSDYYIGDLKDGLFDGLGQLVYSNGTILKGVWNNGRISIPSYGEYKPQVIHIQKIEKLRTIMEDKLINMFKTSPEFNFLP